MLNIELLMKSQVVALSTHIDIRKRIDDLFISNAKFIAHIIRSNFPNCKTKRVHSFIEQNLKNRRCCISDNILTDIESIAKYQSRRDNVPYEMIFSVLNDKRTLIKQIETDSNNRKIALLGERSDKMLCLQAYDELMLWVKEKVDAEDPVFVKLVHDEIIKTLKLEIKQRFDTSLHFNKLSNLVVQDFCVFIDERIIPNMHVNYAYLWERISNSIKNTELYERRKQEAGGDKQSIA